MKHYRLPNKDEGNKNEIGGIRSDPWCIILFTNGGIWRTLLATTRCEIFEQTEFAA